MWDKCFLFKPESSSIVIWSNCSVRAAYIISSLNNSTKYTQYVIFCRSFRRGVLLGLYLYSYCCKRALSIMLTDLTDCVRWYCPYILSSLIQSVFMGWFRICILYVVNSPMFLLNFKSMLPWYQSRCILCSYWTDIA